MIASNISAKGQGLLHSRRAVQTNLIANDIRNVFA